MRMHSKTTDQAVMRRCAWVGLLVGSCALMGCGTASTLSGQFPATWPAQIQTPRMASAPPTIGPGSGIAIAVAPWTWASATNLGGSPATTEVLTQLTHDALRARGFEVVDDAAAAYRLSCSVRDLSYTVRGGVPGARQFAARASCQLLRAGDQRVLWQRDIAERVDETLYVNTYTRLPSEHQRAFARECLPALMDRVTDSLLLFLRDELPLQDAAASPAPGAPAAPPSEK